VRRITGVAGAGAGVDAGGSRVRAVGKAAAGVVGADEAVDDDEGRRRSLSGYSRGTKPIFAKTSWNTVRHSPL
jgi:hypothetical protein